MAFIKKSVFLVLLVLISNTIFAQSEDEQKKREVVIQILSVTGAIKQMEAAVDQMVTVMLPVLKQSVNGSKIPQEFKDKFVERFPINFVKLFKLPENFNAFLEPSIQGYVENFTLAELQGMLAFYDSPLGKKMSSLQPEMMKISMSSGQTIGQRIGVVAAQLTAQELKASK
jgi:uncharacterized protein